VPFLLRALAAHAARLPTCDKSIMSGGDVDSTKTARWLAPWSTPPLGTLTVLPRVSYYQSGKWHRNPPTSRWSKPEVYAKQRPPEGPARALAPENEQTSNNKSGLHWA